jgi:hypothetical protein
MTDEFDNEVKPASDAASSLFRRKYPWAMLVVVILFVVIPFISWYGTWFGRPLSNSQISEYLDDSVKYRHVQQALEQIVDRIGKHDPAAKQWYAKVAALSSHPAPEVRKTAAWAMQYDPTSEEFHSALRAMLDDQDPGVRHQAALSLVSFNDASGRAEIVSMLKPYSVKAAGSGKLTVLLKEGDAFSAGSPVARIQPSAGPPMEQRAPEPGAVETIKISSDRDVTVGDEIAVLSPSGDQVWEALRALYYVGQPDDIAPIQHYMLDLPGMPDRVRRQATQTTQAIRYRAQGAGISTEPGSK